MYVYLYDPFLRKRKFDSTMKAIETRLTDFGIAGKIVRLQQFTNAQQLIDQEIAKGATTIIIVGNDITFGHVLSRAALCDTTFGFIPVGPNNSISEVLGLPIGAGACEVLAKRRKVALDVGWFNNRYFVSRLHINPSNISIKYDDKFTVSGRDGNPMELVVCNLQPFTWKNAKTHREVQVHPQDGKLEAFVRPVLGKKIIRYVYDDPSIFPFQEMVVSSKKPFAVEADGKISKETKITIRLAKNRLNMIVGRQRFF